MEQNEITYQCKAALYTPGVLVGIMVGVGMPVMFLTMFIHPIVAVFAMVGSMFGIMFMLTGNSVFTMNAAGIHRSVSTTIKLGKNKESKNESHAWDQLKWFKEGKDKGNYTAEYHYLTLHFKNGSEWMITDNNGGRYADFMGFLDTFKAIVAERNQLAAPVPVHSNIETMPVVPVHKHPEQIIEQRKTFYETAWAKIFTILLGAIILIFLYLKYATTYMNASGTFKLFAVLIPGFFYMWYRVFREKK